VSVIAGNAATLDPFAPGFRIDPYPMYARLRDEEPVAWSTTRRAGFWGFWFVSRYADVVTVLKHPAFGRELKRLLPESAFPPIPEEQQSLFSMVEKWMVLRDPPDHTRLRASVMKAFTPRVVEELYAATGEIARELLAGLDDRFDLISDFAFPLPIIVIARMLGVPEEDRQQFRRWSRALFTALDLRNTPDDLTKGSEAAAGFLDYFRHLAAQRRREPRGDLLSALLAAQNETQPNQSQPISDDELMATCVLLLFAGHETTVNLIGNGMASLLRNRDQLDRLQSDPRLMRTAVEECLRFESPQQIVFRHAFDDVEIGGRRIRKGQLVACGLGSANRDPRQFPNADRFDVGRVENRHLAFGFGIHFCVGAALARSEGQVALETLLAHRGGVESDAPDLDWNDTIMLRGLRSLPLRWRNVG
jgi:cytochrome P450